MNAEILRNSTNFWLQNMTPQNHVHSFKQKQEKYAQYYMR